MAASHGSTAVFMLGTHAAPATPGNVSQYANSVGLSMSRDSAEVTTFALQSKQYIAGLKDATIPLEGPYDPTVDQQMWDLYNFGDIVTWEYYPFGNTTGKIKYTGQAIITSYEVNSTTSDPNATSGELQVTGNVTRSTVP